jgi:hypothetical protein
VRENRTLRLTWRELETWHGRDIVALAYERARNREHEPQPKQARQFSTLPVRGWRCNSSGLLGLTTRRLRYTFCLPVRNRRKHVWSDWRVVSRILERDRKSRSGSRQASDSARGIPLSIAAGPSPAMDGSPGSRGNPSGGSQQHCSAGVCGCSTIFKPF